MKKWLIIGIILLVVIIVSFYFYNKSKKTTNSTTNISSERNVRTCRKCTEWDTKTNSCKTWSTYPCDQIQAGIW